MWVDIVPREIWGASLPTFSKILTLPAKFVFCMSTFSVACASEEACRNACRGIQQHTMKNKGYNDIRYNFVIGGRGQIYEGRGWYAAPLLPIEYAHISKNAILLGFIGYYKESTLPLAMREARDELVNFGIDNKFISEDFQSFKILDRKK